MTQGYRGTAVVPREPRSAARIGAPHGAGVDQPGDPLTARVPDRTLPKRPAWGLLAPGRRRLPRTHESTGSAERSAMHKMAEGLGST